MMARMNLHCAMDLAEPLTATPRVMRLFRNEILPFDALPFRETISTLAFIEIPQYVSLATQNDRCYPIISRSRAGSISEGDHRG